MPLSLLQDRQQIRMDRRYLFRAVTCKFPHPPANESVFDFLRTQCATVTKTHPRIQGNSTDTIPLPIRRQRSEDLSDLFLCKAAMGPPLRPLHVHVIKWIVRQPEWSADSGEDPMQSGFVQQHRPARKITSDAFNVLDRIIVGDLLHMGEPGFRIGTESIPAGQSNLTRLCMTNTVSICLRRIF